MKAAMHNEDVFVKKQWFINTKSGKIEDYY